MAVAPAAPALAATGPVGWGILAASAAVGIASSIFGASASRAQAKAEAYQMQLAENAARLDAHNTIIDLGRTQRFTSGAALAAQGHGAAGIGESFIAVRNDEFGVYSRNVANARLTAMGRVAGYQGESSAARARGRNQATAHYLEGVGRGLQGFLDYRALGKAQ